MADDIEQALLLLSEQIKSVGRREMFLSIAAYDPESALRYLEFVNTSGMTPLSKKRRRADISSHHAPFKYEEEV